MVEAKCAQNVEVYAWGVINAVGQVATLFHAKLEIIAGGSMLHCLGSRICLKVHRCTCEMQPEIFYKENEN